ASAGLTTTRQPRWVLNHDAENWRCTASHRTAQRRTLDEEGDAAAQAAPARRARPRKRRRHVRENRRLDPGWEGVEARQVVGDVVPRRFGAHEDVSDRSDA